MLLASYHTSPFGYGSTTDNVLSEGHRTESARAPQEKRRLAGERCELFERIADYVSLYIRFLGSHLAECCLELVRLATVGNLFGEVLPG